MAKVTNEGVEILRVLCGSRAYGLHNENSDYDYHSVYLVPTSRLLTIDSEVKAVQKMEGDEDSHAWELKHFLSLALKGNPTILETFVAPVVPIPHKKIVGSDWDNVYIGQMLRACFPLVLSKKPIYDSFRGYANSQIHKMGIKDNDRRNLKAALAYLRTMYHGTMLLLDGTYTPEIPPRERGYFMQFKEATAFTSDLMSKFNQLKYQFEIALDEAYSISPLPDEPNKEEVNNFILRVRRQTWVL